MGISSNTKSLQCLRCGIKTRMKDSKTNLARSGQIERKRDINNWECRLHQGWAATQENRGEYLPNKETMPNIFMIQI